MAFATAAEADAEGERIYRSADLIVEATAGDLPERYRSICSARSKPRPELIGQRLSSDRPLAVHRVIKGVPPASIMLFDNDAEVFAEGCGIRVNSCEVTIPSGHRTIFVLRRVEGNRYRMESYCALIALRQSARGRALFGAASPAN